MTSLALGQECSLSSNSLPPAPESEHQGKPPTEPLLLTPEPEHSHPTESLSLPSKSEHSPPTEPLSLAPESEESPCTEPLPLAPESEESPCTEPLSLAPVQTEPLPLPPASVVSDSGVSNGSSFSDSGAPACSDGGMTVTVTLCPLERSHSPDDFSSSVPLDTFGPKGVEKGLSTLSLEVMASGDNLNMLSQDDLGGDGSGCGSIPDSVEGEWEGDNRCEESSEVSNQNHSDVVVVGGSGQASNEDSRCSSSMGYLEPRPSSQSPPNNQVFSPKDIQKKLMEKVANINSEHNSEGGGGSKEAESAVAMENLPNSGSAGHSSQPVSKGLSLGSLFRRKSSLAKKNHNPQTLAATSTSGLILHDRPKTLPAKSPAEEHRHQHQHQQMMAAARKKELQKAKEELKKEKMRRERDKLVADSLREWDKILPKWESVHNTKKVRDLWWQGLPPGLRGEVWKKAIGNDLNISSDLYAINLRRCKERLALPRDRSGSGVSQTSLSREHSVEVIHLDVLRTFPTLGFFQKGGPYNKPLHDVLGAYACYRPDIGYVQGMSFIAGVLLLNMDAGDAFVCLANLLNRPSYMAFFKVDHTLMGPYFNTYNILLQDALPKLSTHFATLEFSPEYYLIEWIFTIYTRALPLDVACRVWDLFCRDGDSFLFRTAMGILKQFQSRLLDYRSIEDLGSFLGNLPAASMNSDTLFTHIDSIHFTTKRFKQILSQEQSCVEANSTR